MSINLEFIIYKTARMDYYFLRNFTEAHSRLIEGSAMLRSAGNHGRGVDLRVPEIVRTSGCSQTSNYVQTYV